MKESEAKKKLCPKLLAAFISAGRGNPTDAKNMSLCKGSDCMMWQSDRVAEEKKEKVKRERFLRDYAKHCSDGFKPSHIVKHEGTDFAVVSFRRYVDTDSGDCGLKTKELYCEGCN